MGDYDPASTIEEAAYGVVLDPFHLVKPDHPWYADIEGRLPREHFGVGARLDQIFRSSAKRKDEYVHLGLVGHGGTGKKTLVRQAMVDLREIGILPVYVNALTSLDPSDFTFSDAVLVLADAIVSKLVEVDPNIELDPILVEAVHGWFADVIVSESHKKEIVGELSSEAGFGVPLLGGLLARIKGTLRSSNDYRTEIRRRAGRDPDELVRRVNALVDGIHVALAARKQRICVIFDNLEKFFSRSVVEKALLLRADSLRRLRCHVIYFMAPADEYAAEKIQVSQAFRLVAVPAVPVRERDQPWSMVSFGALDAVELMLSKRLVLDEIFGDTRACIEGLVRWSGGRLRDIVDLARYACEFADIAGTKVTVEHVDRAARKLAGARLVVMRPENWARAVEIHASKQVGNRSDDGHMLLHSLVLAYDGDPWWDVHPLVLADPRFLEAAEPKGA